MIQSANVQMGRMTLALPRCFGRTKACERCGERMTDEEVKAEHAWCGECTAKAKKASSCCIVS
jgi:hypothetical protein